MRLSQQAINNFFPISLRKSVKKQTVVLTLQQISQGGGGAAVRWQEPSFKSPQGTPDTPAIISKGNHGALEREGGGRRRHSMHLNPVSPRN